MIQTTIITHDGRFHADEVLACVLLKKMYPGSNIIRTRDLDIINHYISKKLVIAIVDVFGQYNSDKCYFDHHQRGFETYINGVKCSSAGLIFKHYSSQILEAYGIQTENKDKVIKDIYAQYFRSVDAIDNGVTINCTVNVQNERNSVEHDLGVKVTGKSSDPALIYMRTISSMVAECDNFEEAFAFVNKDFSNFMRSMQKWSLKYDKVKELLGNIGNNDVVDNKYKKSILLTEQMDNIGKIVCEIEGELGLDVRYIVDKQADRYKVFAVPINTRGFETKTPLNEKWRGLRDGELSKTSGIDGCVFVHATGFLGINYTLEGALELCYRSLE